MQLALEIFYLVVGFYFLARGSDWLVSGSTSIADRIGVRPLIIGLTVVAWGTSAPEVVVSGAAAVQGEPGMTMGNVLGSNVANIGLVLGACAVILPEVLHKALGKREAFWLLAAVGSLWWAVFDLELTRLDAGLLLGAFGVYNLQLLVEARSMSGGPAPERQPGDSWLQHRPVLSALLGTVVIALAAWAAVEGARGIAPRLGISKLVVGLTVLAVGTSLPEFAAGIRGALRGHAEISVGNVVGSNVFNVLAAIGIVGLIRPFGGVEEPGVQEALRHNLRIEFPIVLVFSLAAILLPVLGRGRGGRAKGMFLLLAYIGYTIWLLVASNGTDLSAS